MKIPTTLKFEEEYRLVWNDEFEGNALDTSKWIYEDPGKRRDAINVEDCVAVSDGNLVLTTKKVGDEIHTGMVSTRGIFEPIYGYLETRVRFQQQTGHWSAFWLLASNFRKGEKYLEKCPELGISGWAEIDIFEYLVSRKDTVFTNVHWHRPGEKHVTIGGEQHTDPGFPQGYHTVGLKWTKDEYVFYIDGKEQRRVDKGITREKVFIILSLEVQIGGWGGLAEDIRQAQMPDSIYFDYVRVYQPAGG